MSKDAMPKRWNRVAEYWLENDDFDLNKALEDAPAVEGLEADEQACLEANINFMNERYMMAVASLGTVDEETGKVLENEPMPEPSEAIPIELFNFGFDVWIEGNRGSIYNSENETLSRADQAYWNFSYKDMAMDQVEAINFITEKTGA